MKNERAYGVYFRKGNDCGIAKITVYNSTTSKYIAADGSTSDTLVYRLVDLYMPSSGYTTLEKDFVYWIKLEVNDVYEITVENSGTHNAAASSPYNINIVKYIEATPLIDASITSFVTLRHDDHPSDTIIKTLSEGSNDLEQINSFNGDGTTKVFGLSGTFHAADFYKFSEDSGTTWISPSSYKITWGSNSPNYDNETIDSNGYFSINFLTAPVTGTGNIKIKWYPKLNKLKLNQTMIMPNDGDTYKEFRGEFNIMDYGIEIIP